MEDWILAPIGFVIALFSSLVGIGGGLLWAPFFILIKGLDFKTAIVLSFTVQILGMGSASLTNFRIKSTNWKMIFGLLPVVALGVVIGGLFSQKIADQKHLERGLGVLSIIEALFFSFQVEKYNAEINDDVHIKSPLWLKMQSVLFGIFAGMFSIGISDFIIPVLRGKLKIPMKNAIGTSVVLNLFSACVGSAFCLIFFNNSLPDDTINILLYCWIGVIIGGQVGPRLTGYIADDRMKEIFIFILLMLGIHLIYQSM